jgi:flagellar basal-body rod modification protein FlgD
MNSTAVTASGSTAQTAAQTSSSNSLGGGMDSMFMQLLVTQLQNQDPLSPMDPSTFVTQLVGVNSLDQLTQINQVLHSALTGSATTNAGGQ